MKKTGIIVLEVIELIGFVVLVYMAEQIQTKDLCDNIFECTDKLILQSILAGSIVISNLLIQLIVHLLEKQVVGITNFYADLRSMRVNFVMQFKISTIVIQVISFSGIVERYEGLNY